MSDTAAKAIIDGLTEPFDRAVIKKKPGSKPGATKFKPASDYVSHGLVTKRLNAVCPGWSSRVVEWHTFIDGRGELVCAGVTLEITIPGAGSHQEFGKSANRLGFGDDAKNALSDALKRCAMRFGVAIDLWESAEEDDEDAMPWVKGAEGVGPDFNNLPPTPRAPVQQRPPQRAQQAPQPAAAPATAGEYGWTELWRDLRGVGIKDRGALNEYAGIIAQDGQPADIWTLVSDKRKATA